MLKTTLLHPEILRALASAGHGSRVLISDGNYPHATATPPSATKVFLNLAPGVLTVTDVLRVLTDAIPVEAAHVMALPDDSEPPVWKEYRQLLPDISLEVMERFAFYDAARQPDIALLIATADQQRCANLLLTIGIVFPATQE
ncbi:MAG: RbsD/FucU family protein [bacterium]|jgi:L-fucose mutarotase